jgi:hypothetical protein
LCEGAAHKEGSKYENLKKIGVHLEDFAPK